MNEMFFFYFSDNQPIGFKKLSKADLGLSGTSNQTHIGLYNEVLAFLGDNVSTSAMLIYGSYCQNLECHFDRIENPDGSFRSPKIRMGTDGHDSVVSKIREFAAKDPMGDWYLVWSSLENEELVFWLVNVNSREYDKISALVGKNSTIITPEDVIYFPLKKAMLQKIDNTSLDMQKEIEVISQVGGMLGKYRKYDVEKAAKQLSVIGKQGEELINEYFEKEKNGNQIASFEWLNKSKESGLPYDFVVNQLDSLKLYIDVKSTRFDFEQDIVFSNQEIEFAYSASMNSQYSVYRVFGMKNSRGEFSACSGCNKYMEKMKTSVSCFEKNIAEHSAKLMRMNLAVSPNACFSKIQKPIKL